MANGNFSSKIRQAEQVYGLQGGRVPRKDELKEMIASPDFSQSFLDAGHYTAPQDALQEIKKLSTAMLGDPHKTSPFAEPLMGFNQPQPQPQTPTNIEQRSGFDVESSEGKSRLIEAARVQGCLKGAVTPRSVVQCVSEAQNINPEDAMDMLENTYNINFGSDNQERMNVILDVILEMNKNKLPKEQFPESPEEVPSNKKARNLPLRYQSFSDMTKNY